VTELPTSSDTTTAPRVVVSSHTSRRTSRRRPTETVPPAGLTASLTDLSYMVTRVHAIRGRGGVARGLDKRLAGVIADLESLIHDLLHDTAPTSNSAKTPPTRVSGAAGASDRTRTEAAFEAWLTSDDRPEVWEVGGPDDPETSLTGMLGELVLSSRQLPADAADALGMPPGTRMGHAAAELILAVNDPAGPRCRSYRSALYFLRDHDGTFVNR
jgi:hypothetical protein